MHRIFLKKNTTQTDSFRCIVQILLAVVSRCTVIIAPSSSLISPDSFFLPPLTSPTPALSLTSPGLTAHSTHWKCVVSHVWADCILIYLLFKDCIQSFITFAFIILDFYPKNITLSGHLVTSRSWLIINNTMRIPSALLHGNEKENNFFQKNGETEINSL